MLRLNTHRSLEKTKWMHIIWLNQLWTARLRNTLKWTVNLQLRRGKKSKNQQWYFPSTVINTILFIVPTWLWVLKGFPLHLTDYYRANVMTLIKRSLEKIFFYKPWLEAAVILHEKEHTQGCQVRYQKVGRWSFLCKTILKACTSTNTIWMTVSQKGSSD